jgi:hypothetical protein
MSPQKIEVIDNILAERSSLLLENWQKFFKNCPHQELVSKFVEISSKFGETQFSSNPSELWHNFSF